MPVEILPYDPDVAKDLFLQPSQSYLQELSDDPGYRAMLPSLGPAYMGIADGRCVAAFGVIMDEVHRGTAWGLVSCDASRYYFQIHKAVLKFLNSCGIMRVEARIYEEFAPGHRWATMLGFEPEGVLKHSKPNGENAVMYARITV